MLELGLHPLVTASTSLLLVGASSSSATVGFALADRLNYGWGVIMFVLCTVASVVGVAGIGRVVRRSGRASLIVFLLVFVMAAGGILTAVRLFRRKFLTLPYCHSKSGQSVMSDFKTFSNFVGKGLDWVKALRNQTPESRLSMILQHLASNYLIRVLSKQFLSDFQRFCVFVAGIWRDTCCAKSSCRPESRILEHLQNLSWAVPSKVDHILPWQLY